MQRHPRLRERLVSAPARIRSRVSVEQVVPRAAPVDLDAVLPVLGATPALRPFCPEVVDFCADLARTLARRARHLPEVQALAYWTRRSAVARLAESFHELGDDGTVLVPRGTVFHVPPANVDTIFVYSWLLSVLCGNRNVVRLSSRTTEQTSLLVEVVRDLLADHAAVADTTLMVRYGHDRAATDAASAACDLRVVWGGDGAVDAVRASPLRADAVDVTFSDRSSLAVIRADAYARLSDAGRDELVRDFYSDTYWFDQLGCSSPRALLWVGGTECAALGSDFFGRLRDEVARRGYTVDTAGALAKLGFGYRTLIDQPVTAYAAHGNELTVVSVDGFPDVGTDFCGGGMFLQHRLDGLDGLAGHVDRRVQTLTQFGFAHTELRALAVELNGRGVDRIVPFGRALTFGRVWDGYDLLQSFTRRVVVGA